MTFKNLFYGKMSPIQIYFDRPNTAFGAKSTQNARCNVTAIIFS